MSLLNSLSRQSDSFKSSLHTGFNIETIKLKKFKFKLGLTKYPSQNSLPLTNSWASLIVKTIHNLYPLQREYANSKLPPGENQSLYLLNELSQGNVYNIQLTLKEYLETLSVRRIKNTTNYYALEYSASNDEFTVFMLVAPKEWYTNFYSKFISSDKVDTYYLEYLDSFNDLKIIVIKEICDNLLKVVKSNRDSSQYNLNLINRLSEIIEVLDNPPQEHYEDPEEPHYQDLESTSVEQHPIDFRNLVTLTDTSVYTTETPLYGDKELVDIDDEELSSPSYVPWK